MVLLDHGQFIYSKKEKAESLQAQIQLWQVSTELRAAASFFLFHSIFSRR